MVFVLPDMERYWPLVKHCRARPPVAEGKHRVPPTPWYDLAVGPVARRWQGDQHDAIEKSDQFSFHTAKSIAVLNAVRASGNLNFRYYQV
jgi:hypothetical protein